MSFKILVADDEPDAEMLFRQFFRARIRSGEIALAFAENGKSALDQLTSDTTIDLLFTDINMPVMDGLTLLERMREQNLQHKAIVISAYGDMENIRTAMNRGAFDFVTKPITIEDLNLTLAKAIRETEAMRKGVEAEKNYVRVLEEKEKLILGQNEMLEAQVLERTKEVEEQRGLLEKKNKEIVDSIHYAKRLQEAMLPPVSELKEIFPESFVLFEPKDIVSGDFYWVYSQNDLTIVAAGDCTGHGVAGAFMSVYGISMLDQIVKEKGILAPNEILNHLHDSVIHSLKRNERESHAGMDIAIISFDKKKNEVQFSGAKRPLWLVRNSELQSFTADRLSIGSIFEDRISYQLQTIPISKHDALYIFSDGYADQFGGADGKKLMTSKMKEMLIAMHNKSATEQESELKNYFTEWKGNHEQVDDVVVIGIVI